MSMCVFNLRHVVQRRFNKLSVSSSSFFLQTKPPKHSHGEVQEAEIWWIDDFGHAQHIGEVTDDLRGH